MWSRVDPFSIQALRARSKRYSAMGSTVWFDPQVGYQFLPSSAPGTLGDDVVAALNSNDFVAPRDSAAAKGTQVLPAGFDSDEHALRDRSRARRGGFFGLDLESQVEQLNKGLVLRNAGLGRERSDLVTHGPFDWEPAWLEAVGVLSLNAEVQELEEDVAVIGSAFLSDLENLGPHADRHEDPLADPPSVCVGLRRRVAQEVGSLDSIPTSPLRTQV